MGGATWSSLQRGGADTNPDWYYNLRAHPEARIEVGDDAFDVVAGDGRKTPIRLMKVRRRTNS